VTLAYLFGAEVNPPTKITLPFDIFSRYVPSAVFPKRLHRFARVHGTPWENLLDGLIRGKFILRRGAISTQRARPTAIAVPLVINRMRCPTGSR